jgi:DNA-binding NarL/FixJ family response regulator
MSPRTVENTVIRVLIVDDNAFVRAGVRHLLSQQPDIQVVGECADGSQVPDLANSVQPDVVLMDVQMPVVSGAEATRRFLATHPTAKVLMLTGAMNSRALDEAADAGAVGFLLKGDHPTSLLEAVRTVAAGGTAWPADASPQPH